MELEYGIARLEMRPIREPHVSNSPPEFDANEAVLAAVELDNAHECDSAWNKDPVFGVIGIQSGL